MNRIPTEGLKPFRVRGTLNFISRLNEQNPDRGIETVGRLAASVRREKLE